MSGPRRLGTVGAQAAPCDSLAERIAWRSLLTAVFLIPLANAVFTMPFTGRTVIYDMYDLPKMFVLWSTVFVALGSFSWYVFAEGGRVRASRAFAIIPVLLGWLALVTALSVSPSTSLFGQYQRSEGLVTYLLYAAVFVLTVQLVSSAHRVRNIAMTLVAASAPVSIYGIIQFFYIDPVAWQNLDFAGRAFSTYGNPGGLSNFLVFSVAVSFALVASERSDRLRVTWWLVLLLNILALVLTFTRGAWIGSVVALGVAALILARQGVRPIRKIDLPFSVGAAILLATFALVDRRGDSVTSLPSRLASLVQPTAGSGMTRLKLWEAATGAIADRPAFGFGPDTFQLVFPAYRTPDYFLSAPLAAFADNAHSYPLQLAASVGIVGALLLFGSLAWILYTCRHVIASRASSRANAVVAGFTGAIVGYLVTLLFGISEPGTTFLLWIALGIVAAPSATTAVLSKRLTRTSTAIVAVAICAGLFLYGLVPIFADLRYFEARFSIGQTRTDAVNDAVRLAPYRVEYRKYQTQVHLENARDSVLDALRTEAGVTETVRSSWDSALAYAESAISEFPWDYQDYQLLALSYLFGGSEVDSAYYANVVDVTSRGLARFPNSPILLIQRAEARAAQGDARSAREDLQRSLEMEPRADTTALKAKIESLEATSPARQETPVSP
ncbi:MAG: O-antigen ligase family protein [Coriobacteriia bacterium]|nr:O-antigen ligase family protein [Coriobacteriia bacterium]